MDHREGHNDDSTHTYTDLPPHTSSVRSSASGVNSIQRIPSAGPKIHGPDRFPTKTFTHNPKVEKENGWRLAALFWSVKESRLWSPDRSCLWYSGLCLYGLVCDGVETGEGTSSCRGA